MADCKIALAILINIFHDIIVPHDYCMFLSHMCLLSVTVDSFMPLHYYRVVTLVPATSFELLQPLRLTKRTTLILRRWNVGDAYKFRSLYVHRKEIKKPRLQTKLQLPCGDNGGCPRLQGTWQLQKTRSFHRSSLNNSTLHMR